MDVATERRRGRAGFTLVELLVVMAIIAFLAAIAIYFFPSIQGQANEARGAQLLQGWLSIARQKAIRNQSPYGLRLWAKDIDQTTGKLTMLVKECSYIEQPDDFTGGTITTTDNTLKNLQLVGADPTGGFWTPGAPDNLYAVQMGDYLEVLGTGLMHKIWPPPVPQANQQSGVQTWNPNTLTATFSVASALPYALPATPTYRIVRKPRVVSEETLPLPDPVVVDLNTNTDASITGGGTYSNPLPITIIPGTPPPVNPPPAGAYLDILFSPSGAVITPGMSTNTINLWVRSTDQTYPFGGEPTIIAVYGRTGFVAAYAPVSPVVSPNPYADIR